MSPIEAMEYGIIDGVIDKDAIISSTGLPEVTERAKPREENLAASENPRRFLSPEVPDDEIV
jgi:ATP-dependent Clp protease protease subunit